MTRSRQSAKQAGTAFETLMANWLAEETGQGVERRRLSGSKDRGDLSGLGVIDECQYWYPLVAELKDYGGRLEAGPWINEVERERANAGALAGIVIAKRRGTRDPAEQFVLMSAKDFVAIINGGRP